MSTVLYMKLKRAHHGPGYCVGRLHVDGEWQCYTLEDEVREIETRPCQEWKIPGRTAIPRGTYQLVVNYSNRFKRAMPLLLEVPCYEGIRIHPGNHSGNTEGCILVGQEWDGGDFISHSQAAYDALMSKIQQARLDGKHIYLEIE